MPITLQIVQYIALKLRLKTSVSPNAPFILSTWKRRPIFEIDDEKC